MSKKTLLIVLILVTIGILLFSSLTTKKETNNVYNTSEKPDFEVTSTDTRNDTISLVLESDNPLNGKEIKIKVLVLLTATGSPEAVFENIEDESNGKWSSNEEIVLELGDDQKRDAGSLTKIKGHQYYRITIIDKKTGKILEEIRKKGGYSLISSSP